MNELIGILKQKGIDFSVDANRLSVGGSLYRPVHSNSDERIGAI